MSCSPGAPKLSDVLEALSDESEKMYMCDNAGGEENLYEDSDKQVFTDAVHYCMVLLKQSNRFTSRKSDVLSLEATLMGHEMFERIIGISVQMDVETEDEILAEPSETSEHSRITVKQEPAAADCEESVTRIEQDSRKTTVKEEAAAGTSPVARLAKSAVIEEDSTSIFTPQSTESQRPTVIKIPRETTPRYSLRHSESLSPQMPAAGAIDDDKLLPPSPVSLSGSDNSSRQSHRPSQHSTLSVRSYYVTPLELKQRAVNLARSNPKWSLATLRREAGVPSLSSSKQLRLWAKTVDGGGTRWDKYNTINDLTFERFLEARANNQNITVDMMQDWARQMAKDIYGAKFKFEASKHWTMNFKKIYNLRWVYGHGYVVMRKEQKSTTRPTRNTKE